MPNTTNLLDHIYEGYQLESLLTATYESSDYRFGRLNIPVADAELPSADATHPSPAYTYFDTQVVMHPEKGALLLGVLPLAGDESPRALTRRLAESYAELTWLQSLLHDRLEEDDFWLGRPIVLGVGLVTGQRISPSRRPRAVPDVAVLDRAKLADLARHVDALFSHYTEPEALPANKWGNKLIEELTDPDAGICEFIGEDSLIASYENWEREFDGLVRPAA